AGEPHVTRVFQPPVSPPGSPHSDRWFTYPHNGDASGRVLRWIPVDVTRRADNGATSAPTATRSLRAELSATGGTGCLPISASTTGRAHTCGALVTGDYAATSR